VTEGEDRRRGAEQVPTSTLTERFYSCDMIKKPSPPAMVYDRIV